MINIGIIGFGYWGPNLTRNFSHHDKCRVKTVSDLSEKRLSLVNKMYPSVKTTTDHKELLKDPGIDGVVIATPIGTHYELAKEVLLAGKHVFIEKPMTISRKSAEELAGISTKNKKAILVDHIYLYNDAIRKIKKIIKAGQIGKIQYFDSIRVSLGLFNNQSNVLWDLAVHDLSILNYLVDDKPYSVIATGVSHTDNKIENIAYVTLNYSSGMIAHINCSWISPVKIRQTLLGGTEKMIVFNDLEPTEKIKIYDTQFSIKDREKMMVDYRIGDINIPQFDTTEALAVAADDFVKAITKGTKPVSGIDSGIAVVSILEAAEKSIKTSGKEVRIKWK